MLEEIILEISAGHFEEKNFLDEDVIHGEVQILKSELQNNTRKHLMEESRVFDTD
jgi:hypothetical protein